MRGAGRADGSVGEMGEQDVEPTGRRLAVGIDERHQLGGGGPPPGVTGRGRATRRPVADDAAPHRWPPVPGEPSSTTMTGR